VALSLRQLKSDKALRYRVEKWWWVLNVPAALYLYLFQQDTWERVSIIYLALVSIHSLVITAGGAEQAAEAAAEAKK
jgi:hypothetical protein